MKRKSLIASILFVTAGLLTATFAMQTSPSLLANAKQGNYKYGVTFDADTNKINADNEFKDVETDVNLDSKENKVTIKGHGVKSFGKSWQIFEKEGYWQNLTHIIGIDSITINYTSGNMKYPQDDGSFMNGMTYILYAPECIDPNNPNNPIYGMKSFYYAPNVTGEYTFDLSKDKPNYFLIKNWYDVITINWVKIKINDACHDFYHRLSAKCDPIKGTISNQGLYYEGRAASMIAKANFGYKFAGWYLNDELVSMNTKLDITMPYNDVEYEARFVNSDVDYAVLTLSTFDIASNGKNTVGSVSINNQENLTSSNIKFNESVTVNAKANAGSAFMGWYDKKDNLLSKDNPYTFNMKDTAYSFDLIAKFNTAVQIDVELAYGSNTCGTVTGSGTYARGDIITISAIPNPGYEFDYWSDDMGNKFTDLYHQTFELTVEESTTYYATFRKQISKPEYQKDFYFGSFPQSGVFDARITSQLDQQVGENPTVDPTGWTSYNDYYYDSGRNPERRPNYYKDIQLDDNKYRAVYLTKKATLPYPEYLTINQIYYFRFEPVMWKVLDDNGTMILKYIIEAGQSYFRDAAYERTINGKKVLANNYEHSDIRYWLNNRFINELFTTAEIESNIAITEVDNSFETFGLSQYRDKYAHYASNNTRDKMYLLSASELRIESYFGRPDLNTTKTNRLGVPSDYVKCRIGNGDSEITENYGWYTRSPHTYKDYNITVVEPDGSVSYLFTNSGNDYGARAVIKYNMN